MISIYDFSILPYALGDVLTWSMKQTVKALNQKDSNIDVCIYTGEKVNIHQDKYINKSNHMSYMSDLIPAFYTNPLIESVYIFDDEHDMCLFLPEDMAAPHFLNWDKKIDFLELNKILFNEISSHAEINQFFLDKKHVPNLVSPKGFDHKAIEVPYIPLKEGILIGLHLRARGTDTALGAIETHRDSSLSVWKEFLMKAQTEFPHVRFVIMGKPSEKTYQGLMLNNVIYPRMLGWGLAQELAFITRCDAFMGSCSGFAAMAAFTQTPYLITKCDERSYKNYGIPFGTNKLPFATDKQFLVHGEETVDMLMAYFKILI